MEIAAFARDAWRLINIFALPISQSAPHIYLSMLPLTADESRVSAHYLQRTSSLVRVTRSGVKRRSPLLKLILIGGYIDSVYSVEFSPDGSHIATVSDDYTVRIWDAERGELVSGPFNGLVGWINSISFSPDGTRIVVGGESGITVSDVESGSIVLAPFGGGRAHYAYVSPDGKHIISMSSNAVNMWDLETGMAVGEPFIGLTDTEICFAHSRDDRFMALGSRNGSVRAWDVESRRLVRNFVGHTEGVKSAPFSPDGKYVISGSRDKTIRVWDMEKGEVNYSPLIGHKESIYSVAYSHDGTRVVSGSLDNTVII